MPYISITTSRPLPPDKAEALKAAIGGIISLLPGKSEAALMVTLSGGNVMYFGGQAQPCAYVDIKVFRSVEAEAEQTFAEAMLHLVAGQLDLAVNNVFLSFTAFPSWGLRGKYLHA